MHEQGRVAGYVGLPKNLLLKNKKGVAVFSLIQGLNREERRTLAGVFRSARPGRGRKNRRSEDGIIIDAFRSPDFRRDVFWKEMQRGVPSRDSFRRSLFAAVDYWLLAEIEPHLDLLAPLDDEAMREVCPCWDALIESLESWAKSRDTRIDRRFFALWPVLLQRLSNWGQLSEKDRVATVNAAFALSSISGNTWFVEELQRRCPDASTYFDGLKIDEDLRNEDEGDDADDTGTMESELDEDENGDVESFADEDEILWRTFGADLASIAEQLTDGDLDENLVEQLDELWLRFDQLKEDHPLRESAVRRLERQLTELETFLRERVRNAVPELVDEEILDRISGTWEQLADQADSDEQRCEVLRTDALRAVTDGEAGLVSLADVRQKRADAEKEYAECQEQERSATGLAERRAVRLRLSEIEETLAGLRRAVDTAEEGLLGAIEPATELDTSATAVVDGSVGTSVEPEPEPKASVETGGVPDQEESRTGGAAVEPPPATENLQQALPEQKPEEPPGAATGEAAVETTASTEGLKKEGGEGAETGKDSDEQFTTEAGNICAPIWQALRSGNAPLARHAAEAIQNLQPAVKVPSPALLTAVSLGQRLQSQAGPLAGALRQAFADIDRNEFESGPEPWRLANNLLLLAACLRPLILAPDTGASAVSQYIHLGAGMEPLFDVQALLAEYGQRLKGNRLDAAALGAVRSKAAWDEEHKQLQSDILEWRDRAPRFAGRFKAATDVWRRWIQPDGHLGRLVSLLETGQSQSAQEVRELCENFSDFSSFRALVDETDRKQNKRQRGEDIYAAAFEQLRQKAAEAVTLGERWLSLMEAEPSGGDYLSRQLGELQSRLATSGQEALAALDSPVSEDTWGLLSAARSTVRETLEGLLQLFSGARIPVSQEPRPEVVLGEALLRTGQVTLDRNWRSEVDPEKVLAAVKTFLQSPMTVRTAIDGYVKIGDLRDAQRLMDVSDATAYDVEDMARQLERSLARRLEEFRADCGRVEEEISLALAYSLIREDERNSLVSQVADLEISDVASLRFDRCQRALKQIQSQIADKREARAAELLNSLAELSDRNPQQDYTIIRTAIAEGDFPVATEYLHRAEQDSNAVLKPARARDLFNDFFPERCRQLQKMTELLDATGVRKVIQERKNAAEISYRHLSAERAESAAATWTQWCKLKGNRAPTPDMLRALLASLGFGGTVISPAGRTPGRVREFSLTTSVLSDRSVCQAPYFGSRAEGRYRLVCLWESPSQEDLRQLAGDAATGHATLAIYFGALSEQKRRELSVLARGDRRQSFLLLDELLLLFICGEEDSPTGALFQCGLPFTHTDPFVTTSSVVPPEMFFGRAEELASIKSMDGRCFVYGGRQLGKTALLRQAEREFHAPEQGRVAVWIDLKRLARPDDIWVPIWRELRRHGIVPEKIAEPRRTERSNRKIDDFVHALEQWMIEHPAHRVLLLLDEADRFLEFDARDRFSDTQRLKALMEVTERRFKVVFAGLHNVLRTTEQVNHPLAHLGEAIEIGPLIRPDDLRAARELVIRPLMAAGFAFEGERRADRILALTNYYPSLIQLYCSKLLHELLRNGGANLDRRAGPRYLITTKHLDSVYARQDLRDEIRSKFLLTLKLDPRYNLITYALADEINQEKVSLENGATVEEIRRIAEAWWKEGFERTTEPAFRVLLQEMVGLGVLREVKTGTYTLRNPNVLLLLGSATEIAEELVRDRELPAEYEPLVWRMALPSDPTGPRRSALTVTQVADVLAATNGVVVVSGSEAAGIREVQESIAPATETGFFQVMETGGAGDLAAFQRTMDRLSDRKTGGTTVLFVGPDCPWCANWVRYACVRVDRLKSEKNPVRVVFVADPTTLRVVMNEGLPGSVQLVSLEPWSDAFLREWLQETNQPFDGGVRAAIMEQTGGWPEFVHEWGAAGALTIDTEGEAERRLRRIGVDDPQLLSMLDGKTHSELADELGAEQAAHLVRWAELLKLSRTGADGKAHLDPYVAELLMRI